MAAEVAALAIFGDRGAQPQNAADKFLAEPSQP